LLYVEAMILLTGAAGFIGSHAAEAWAQNHRLLLVDLPEHFRSRAYPPQKETDLWDWARGLGDLPHKHRILDRTYLPKILEKIGPQSAGPQAKEAALLPTGEKIEWVVHLGACTDTAETRLDFLQEWNVDYSKSLWNWCVKHKVPLIYASSGSTYGAGEFGFKDDWTTAEKLAPLNPYGRSKQEFDLWVRQEEAAGRTPPFWYGLKFFNVYGPREDHKGPMASAVLHSFKRILATGRTQLFRSHHPKVKDGEQTRDFIHVQDIVSLMNFFQRERPASGLYNCGTGQSRTFKALVEAVFKAMGLEPKLDWIDTPAQYRAAYQYFTEADMARTKAAGYLGPFTSLEEGVGSYVSWLKERATPSSLPTKETTH
jgi:ADP-L-glycero-D-manno-heptose 6-epimerase